MWKMCLKMFVLHDSKCEYLHVPGEKINCIAFSCFKFNSFENVLKTIWRNMFFLEI